MKSELEAAIKLLENGLNDKQDLVVRLREQLEQVKKINLDFVDQIQVLTLTTT